MSANKATFDIRLGAGKEEKGISRDKIQAVVPASELKKLFYAFTVEYSVWCIDIVILSYIAIGPKNEFDAEAAKEIGDLYVEQSPLYKLLQPDNVKPAQRELREQLSEYAVHGPCSFD